MAIHGGCLCGGVRYEIRAALSQPIACHCSQCAKTSGNYAAMASCRSADLDLIAAETLTWFQSSELVRRGFCARCGGNVFWKMEPGEETYVTAGTLEQPTGLRLAEHIFVASKADFYEITDGLPQKPEW
ncbi:glutathione-dependent formaldehyde-activating GFA [Methylocella silvestris BL2]|uniref:Glutathione-dependent formaldehyde-activating GFA n=1 Tax=Methylocella silvestris (strain DSM 15510 / CIP 108128 / LMG 27833 / NCIMB 13906 / BL2) TaxID=395965 RepID=B8ESF9_METSB|nr:GFA family protein [Methylocella silvestris]ACK49849.1 glutathione-dependent formaldehyde-activating GFA [Methylocella silvestris BL2]